MMEAVAETPDTTEADNEQKTEHQMLLAMRALDHQIQVLKAKQQQKRKGWADRLKESTQGLNERIREPIPSGDCRERLDEIQELDREKQKLEGEKSSELEGIKQEIAEAESAFYEILRRRANPQQTNLNFGQASDSRFDPKAGLLLSQSHLSAVRAAADKFSEDTDGEVDGMDELTSRLDDLGVAGFEFPAEVNDEDADGDDSDDDGDD